MPPGLLNSYRLAPPVGVYAWPGVAGDMSRTGDSAPGTAARTTMWRFSDAPSAVDSETRYNPLGQSAPTATSTAAGHPYPVCPPPDGTARSPADTDPDQRSSSPASTRDTT